MAKKWSNKRHHPNLIKNEEDNDQQKTHQEYSDQLLGAMETYMKDAKKKNEQVDFDKFYRRLDKKHGDELLSVIDKSWAKLTFEQIKNEHFLVEEMLDEEKVKSIDDALKPSPKDSEEHLINKSLQTLRQFVDPAWPLGTVGINFQDFADEFGVSVHGDARKWGCHIKADPAGHNQYKNIAGLRYKREQFLRDKGVELDDKGIPKQLTADDKQTISQLLRPRNHDMTQKLTVSAAAMNIREQIDAKSVNTHKADLLASYDQLFEEVYVDWSQRPPQRPSVFSQPKTLREFQSRITEFLEANQWVLSDEDRELIAKTTVTNNDINQAWQECGDLTPSEDPSGKFQEFSQRSFKYKKMFNKIASKQLLNEFAGSYEFVKETIKNVEKTVDYPTSINQLLQQYPLPEDHDYLWSLGEEGKQYKKLKFERKGLYGLMAEAQDPEKRKEYNQQIEDMQEKINDLERKIYLNHLKKKVNDECNALWIKQQWEALSTVLTKRVANQYAPAALTKTEQQTILDFMVEKQLAQIDATKTPEMLGIDMSAYKQFVRDIYNLEKDSVTIPTAWGDLTINFARTEGTDELMKWLQGKPITSTVNIADIANKENFPFVCTLSLDDNAERYLHMTMWSDALQKIYPKNHPKEWTEGGLIIGEWYKVTIKKGNELYTWYLSAKAPRDRESEGKKDEPGMMFLYDKPVDQPHDERNIIRVGNAEKGEPVMINTARDDTTGKPHKDNNEHERDIEIQEGEKNLTLSWERLKRFVTSFMIGDSSRTKELDEEQQKEVADQLEDIKGYTDTNEQDIDQQKEVEQATDNEDNESEQPLSDREQCLQNWDDHIRWYAFPTHIGHTLSNGKQEVGKWLAKWSRLRIRDKNGTDLPPKDNGRFWKYFEITNIGHGKDGGRTMSFKIQGGELPLWSMEWQEYTVDMHAWLFDINHERSIQKIFGKDIVKTGSNHSISELRDIWQDAKQEEPDLKIWNDLEPSWPYFNQWWKKITHFMNDKHEYADKDGKPQAIPIIYGIEQQGENYVVTAQYPDKDNDGKMTTKWYKHIMDKTAFMLFVAEKKLEPKEKTYVDALAESYNKKAITNSIPQKSTTWLWLSHVMGFFKESAGKVSEYIKKDKEFRIGVLNDKMAGDRQIFDKLSSVFGDRNVVGQAFEEMHLNAESEGEKRARKKIEDHLEQLKKWHHSVTINPKILPYVEKAAASDKPIKYSQRLKVASWLMYMCEKEHGPYGRWLKKFAGQGIWIKALYGVEMQQRYLQHMKQIHGRFIKGDQDINDDTFQDLVRCEIQFIVDNIRGGRYMVGDDLDKTLRMQYSRDFANKLMSAYDGTFMKKGWAYEEQAQDLESTGSFSRAYDEFKGALENNRIKESAWSLRAMAILAKSPAQRRQFEGAVLMGIISGTFVYETDLELKYEIESICRSANFPLGKIVRNYQSQEKIQHLLNFITGGKFSGPGGLKYTYNNTTYNFDYTQFQQNYDAGDLGDRGSRIEDFIAWFESRRFTHREDVTWFLGGRTAKDSQYPNDFMNLAYAPKPWEESITYKWKAVTDYDRSLLREYMEYMQEWSWQYVDDGIRNEYHYEDGISVPPAVLVNFSDVDKQWNFKGKDDKDKRRSRQIREMFNDSIPTHTMDKPRDQEKLSFLINKFYHVFADAWLVPGESYELFFKIFRKAQEINTTNPQEAKRLIGFFLFGPMMKNNQPVQIRNTLQSIVDFFCNNLTTINYGTLENAVWPDIANNYNDTHYVYLQEWRDQSTKNSLIREYDKEKWIGKDRIINSLMDDLNGQYRKKSRSVDSYFDQGDNSKMLLDEEKEPKKENILTKKPDKWVKTKNVQDLTKLVSGEEQVEDKTENKAVTQNDLFNAIEEARQTAA